MLATGLVLLGHDSKRDAVHLQHGVYDEVPWRLHRTKVLPFPVKTKLYSCGG
jgi:hypothetical protein